MNATQQAIAAIKAEVPTIAALSSAAVVTLLNVTTTAANPIPQGQVNQSVTDSAVLGKLSATSAGKVLGSPAYARLSNAIDQQNFPLITTLMTVGATVGLISAAEATAVEGLLTTVADPNYQATVPWSVANLGRLIDSHDAVAAGSLP